MNRQTLTYEMLGELMFRRRAAGVLKDILGHVAEYCNANELPPLTAIVVNKARGKPGVNIPTDFATLDRDRENVYRCDWFDIYPPSERELAEVYAATKAAAKKKKP
ncbi:MAG: hypothetical protein DI536_08370 [Archangium gephyra]|uniref:Uncharacterized protein n=1 Tax=Archangium gephyra TaxID=48 RepID=A0A2W5VHM8_9BACT|nr:MAG: hypothetical protein DI536_08370 [Archangium gephyra]